MSIELALNICIWILVAFAFVTALGTAIVASVVTFRIVMDLFGEGT